MTIDRTQTEYHDRMNNHLVKTGIATGPASYATGGDLTATPALFGLSRIDSLIFEPFQNGTVIILARWNPTAQAVQFYAMAGTEQAAAANLSAYTARFIAVGR